MPDLPDLPAEMAAYLEPYYVEPFGEVPPVPRERMETGAQLDLEFNTQQEAQRARALFSDVFDDKTSQLLALAMLADDGGPGPYWHARAARRYGASWEELYKVVEIATFFKGFGALMSAGRAVGRVWKEENGEA